MLKVKCFRNTFFGYVRNCQTSSFLNKLIRGKYKPLNTLIYGYYCGFVPDHIQKVIKISMKNLIFSPKIRENDARWQFANASFYIWFVR